ncbi:MULTISPECIES: nickel-type superoxide dismutase maturation protease [unclassified Synechococcus]|uniref:nickel-type superoxide dismutase maturation protease n=1 Tax=unclassified Synechococcus TaxID=2626047 RepID=UPI001CF814B4|nr:MULTISPECIES: nickel-type superoxide dismutase maturation protease [unclassified Synechococcus]MCB4377223.1 nickel-type superoxide dismutase maturation protease [Synechococcus sp. MU1650]MCB4411614.1 nickel-type superoxide dismutase maturation protease [Synechococcus sp. MU1611]
MLLFCGRRLLLRIEGRSMQPTLEPGDRVLVRRLNSSSTLRLGSVLVTWHPQRSDIRLIKRLNRIEPNGLWLLGDHQAESTDSRQLGTVATSLLIGEVVARLTTRGSEQDR